MFGSSGFFVLARCGWRVDLGGLRSRTSRRGGSCARRVVQDRTDAAASHATVL